MTTGELLKFAEADLKISNRPDLTTEQAGVAALRAIAASLLVIARGSK